MIEAKILKETRIKTINSIITILLYIGHSLKITASDAC